MRSTKKKYKKKVKKGKAKKKDGPKEDFTALDEY